MKRAALTKANGKVYSPEDPPPTQLIPEEDVDDMGDYSHDPEVEGIHDGSGEEAGGGGEWPEQPDLGWYLSHWDISAKGMIAICRTFANYLSAQQPKTVEAKPGRYSGKKLKR